MTGNVDELLATALSIARSAPHGMLITTAGAVASARLTEHLAVGPDATIWIATSDRSRKVACIRDDPTVVYAVEDRTSFAYATFTGTAGLMKNPARATSLWEPGLDAFFAGGATDEDVALIRVEPRRIELMSFAAGIHPDPYGLTAAVLERRAVRWHAAGTTATGKPPTGVT